MVTPGSGELLSIAARLLLPLPALGTRTLKPRRQNDQGETVTALLSHVHLCWLWALIWVTGRRWGSWRHS